MVGIDLTNVSRFEKITFKTIERFLSKEEIITFKQTENKNKFLATRWAIKEAIFKADNSEYSFNKINIEKKNNIYVYKNFIISTSYEKDTIIAFVIKKEN
ncbi:4'-phosphopantetheinyl transferase superfamily protein [[Mycoplasma] collis]|uniref:4'-phosphopantetheinyl transferase superfamily protein n=1 Tax=[Mycoplasma] collis TaxID=2127 RepID=UPI00051AB653|nr:4'-phosphopantetheinyl transferase superfamily protein [[Mycoplasma] collis]